MSFSPPACKLKRFEDNPEGKMEGKQTFLGSQSRTGLAYDELMLRHFCLWEPNHIETPKRLESIWNLCNSEGLVERCHRIAARKANLEEIGYVHEENYIKQLQKSSEMSDEELESLSAQFDDVFLNRESFELALLSAGYVLNSVESVMTGECQNALALVRPPGHHAMKAEANGFCLLNNVAIAAQFAKKKFGVERVLIVDFDVHHGQGVQQSFYDDPNVLYFSAHRYEKGKFWPYLSDSNYDWLGEGKGLGFNVNFPLNKVGLTDTDYLAIVDQLLMPVAVEFRPQLVLISAGFDAAVGCPEGLMALSPAFFAHFTRRLMCLAEGKVVSVLEGGYNLDSLAFGAMQTLRALLNDPIPRLPHPTTFAVDQTVMETITNLTGVLSPYWSYLKVKWDLMKKLAKNDSKTISIRPTPYEGGQIAAARGQPYPTRGHYQPVLEETKVKFRVELNKLNSQSGTTAVPKFRTALGYDDRMALHYDRIRDAVENPTRITSVAKHLHKWGLSQRCLTVKGVEATEDQLELVHTRDYIAEVKNFPDDYINAEEEGYPTYTSTKTYEAATVAVGTVLEVVGKVLSGECLNGFALVRPPGHHAQTANPAGFCFFNTLAIAAKFAQKSFPTAAKRILILDWDIHYGDGISEIFAEDPTVLYISLHRYGDGQFYPKKPSGSSRNVGKGNGVGFNVNIAWKNGGKSNLDYLVAFYQVIMPIAYEFNPDLILVAAGFDGVEGDPLGECRLSPQIFAHFISQLNCLANGRMILSLEGGYNVESLKKCVDECLYALLGKFTSVPVPKWDSDADISTDLIDCLGEVLTAIRPYWKSLECWQSAPNLSNSVTSGLAEFLGIGAEIPDSDGRLYAVEPLQFCPHLAQIQPIPTGMTVDVKTGCHQCGTVGENWICLTCFQVGCSRFVNGDGQSHADQSGHPMALSFADLSAWCYACDSYVHHSAIGDVKRAAYRSKFGVELPSGSF